MTKPEWTSRYNCHSLDIGDGLDVTVDWCKDGFKVQFMRLTLVTRFAVLEEAKQAGILLAKRTLAKAILSLNEVDAG